MPDLPIEVVLERKVGAMIVQVLAQAAGLGMYK